MYEHTTIAHCEKCGKNHVVGIPLTAKIANEKNLPSDVIPPMGIQVKFTCKSCGHENVIKRNSYSQETLDEPVTVTGEFV